MLNEVTSSPFGNVGQKSKSAPPTAPAKETPNAEPTKTDVPKPVAPRSGSAPTPPVSLTNNSPVSQFSAYSPEATTSLQQYLNASSPLAPPPATLASYYQSQGAQQQQLLNQGLLNGRVTPEQYANHAYTTAGLGNISANPVTLSQLP
jgi:hypothetical protein